MTNDDTYRQRRNQDLSMNTTYIRNMLNVLSLAHASKCNEYSTPENCDWLYTNSGTIPAVNVSKINYTDELDRINNTTAPYRDDDASKTTHNGQRCGVHGLNDDTLEYCIGTMLKVNVNADTCTIDLDVADKTTDFRAITLQYLTNQAEGDSRLGDDILSNGKVLSNIGTELFSTYILDSKLLSTVSVDSPYPYMVKNNFTPSNNLAYISNDVSKSKVFDSNTIEYYKYNNGILGDYTAATTDVERIDYYKHTYNENLSLAWNMDSINIGDNRVGFIIDPRGDYSNETETTFSFYMVTLYGGVMNYKLDDTNTVVLSNQHPMSLTWYRVGMSSNLFKPDDESVKIRTSSRLVILPDMTKIKQYVDDGTYQQEYEDDVKLFPNGSGHPGVLEGPSLYTKDQLKDKEDDVYGIWDDAVPDEYNSSITEKRPDDVLNDFNPYEDDNEVPDDFGRL